MPLKSSVEDRVEGVERGFAEIAGVVEATIAVETVELRHLAVTESEVKNAEVFLEVDQSLGLRDRHGSALHGPTPPGRCRLPVWDRV